MLEISQESKDILYKNQIYCPCVSHVSGINTFTNWMQTLPTSLERKSELFRGVMSACCYPSTFLSVVVTLWTLGNILSCFCRPILPSHIRQLHMINMPAKHDLLHGYSWLESPFCVWKTSDLMLSIQHLVFYWTCRDLVIRKFSACRICTSPHLRRSTAVAGLRGLPLAETKVNRCDASGARHRHVIRGRLSTAARPRRLLRPSEPEWGWNESRLIVYNIPGINSKMPWDIPKLPRITKYKLKLSGDIPGICFPVELNYLDSSKNIYAVNMASMGYV